MLLWETENCPITALIEQRFHFRITSLGKRHIAKANPTYGVVVTRSQSPTQVCDRFAAAGYNVAMPDFCKGKQWLVENFPPKDMQVCRGLSARQSIDRSISNTKGGMGHVLEFELAVKAIGKLSTLY